MLPEDNRKKSPKNQNKVIVYLDDATYAKLTRAAGKESLSSVVRNLLTYVMRWNP